MSSLTPNAGQAISNGYKKRPHQEGKRQFKNKNKRQKLQSEPGQDGSNEDVLLADVLSILKLQDTIPSSEEKEPTAKFAELPQEIDAPVTELSSTGDGLALLPGTHKVLVVPFTIPGDTARVKIFKQNTDRPFLQTDFLRIEKASAKRDEKLIKCPYFAKCSGCQFQMLSYADQLAHKRRIIEKAYRNFSGLESELVPQVNDTIGSPLQYGYRTKLTPHFDGPQGARRLRRKGETPKWSEVPPIGFMKKGTRSTLDIEDCPIGTDAVRKGMKAERQRVAEQLDTYQRGATLLLRESTERIPKSKITASQKEASSNGSCEADDADAVLEDRGQYIHKKTCITDSNATSTEYIDDYVFSNPAGAFFQNNNSILPPFTSYIRSHILPSNSSLPKITNLVDAYSGSGLFTITLSSLFNKSLGIDIASSSIASANQNAKLNNLDPAHAAFRAADASAIFADITFPADETVVVIDPPRKGCDENFLRQLLRYAPARVVYVSCNVHTQARDVGVLVRGMEDVERGEHAKKCSYKIESLQGFDFFPQTGHVEGVAVLARITVDHGS